MTLPDYSTAGTWHDQAPAVAAAVATDLRLTSTDPDRETLEQDARAACRSIDEYLQLQPATGRLFYSVTDLATVTTYADGAAPPDVLQAAHLLTAELHKRRRTPFGITDSWSPSGEALRIGRDHLAGVESLLQPHVEGWGLA